jgi:hypothetical protein
MLAFKISSVVCKKCPYSLKKILMFIECLLAGSKKLCYPFFKNFTSLETYSWVLFSFTNPKIFQACPKKVNKFEKLVMYYPDKNKEK